MNYIREMNAFVDWLETNPLDAITQALWYHLMAISNKCNWPQWFTVANRTLQAKLGVDKKTVIRHRHLLVQKNRIEYKSQGKREAGKYRLIPFGGENRGNAPPNQGPNEGPNGEPIQGPKVSPLYKQNETKQNEKDRDNTIPFPAIVGHLNQVCGTNFRPQSRSTRESIRARWREGFRLSDFQKVIDNKAADWLDDPERDQYLRPITLFGVKFESYLNQGGEKGARTRFAKYAADTIPGYRPSEVDWDNEPDTL